MKLDRHYSLSDLPIPKDARVTRRWTEQMCEMAAHIGAYRTLLVIDALAGQVVKIPKRMEFNRLEAVIGKDGAEIMSRIYGGNVLQVPVGRAALNEARRAGVIAAIRARKMTIADAVPILETSRSYISHLVNQTSEGSDAAVYVPPRRGRDDRQLDMFGGDGGDPSADG